MHSGCCSVSIMSHTTAWKIHKNKQRHQEPDKAGISKKRQIPAPQKATSMRGLKSDKQASCSVSLSKWNVHIKWLSSFLKLRFAPCALKIPLARGLRRNTKVPVSEEFWFSALKMVFPPSEVKGMPEVVHDTYHISRRYLNILGIWTTKTLTVNTEKGTIWNEQQETQAWIIKL